MNIRNLALTTLAASTVALASGCATSPYGSTYGGAPPPASANCYDCGTVTRIEMVAGSSRVPNRTGAGGSYNVYVRMSDGRETVVTQSDLGGIRQGSYVRVYNGRAWPR